MIEQDRKSGYVAEPGVSEEHTELFHYTSIAALKGILKTNTLWATCATHLNDSSEMQLIWTPMKEICTDFVKEAIKMAHPECSGEAAKYAVHDGPMMARLIKDNLLGGNGDDGFGVPFVTSFTTHKNNYPSNHGMLSQWRGYSGIDGVAIVFDAKQIEEMLVREYERFEYFSCSILDAIYYNEQIDLLERFPKLFEAVRVHVKNVIDRRVMDDDVQKNLEVMARKLLPVIGRLKHQAFKEENECRIVVGRPHEEHYKTFFGNGGQTIKPLKRLHYRPGMCGSVPYVRLFELDQEDDNGHKGKIPINRIIVGPSRSQNANVDKVRALVSKLAGNRGITVQRSKIPYVATV